MQSEENNDQQQNPGEWLNLSLGKNPSQPLKSSSESRVKIYSCNFCMRKFYSSQALGGHQNAHKRERGVIRHYKSDKMMKMMAMPIHAHMFRSLGVGPHALVHEPGPHGPAAYVARFNEASARFVAIEEGVGFTWPGSFRYSLQQQEEQLSNSNNLDLNLKL